MTDTAIPLPAEAAQHMADPMMRLFARSWANVVRVHTDGIQHLIDIAVVKAAQQHRVRHRMPSLLMRQVMVHGFVPHKKP